MSFHCNRALLVAFCGMFFLAECRCWAQNNSSPEQLKFFESRIRPVLVRECYGCHSNQVGQVRGGLWLDTAEAMRAGGSSGPAIVPGNLDDSLLWNAINHVDFEMPPNRTLSSGELADFKAWIEMGAPDPRVEEEAEIRSNISQEDIQKGREFWSFKRPMRPEVPNVQSEWPNTTIDRFVHAKLDENGLQPAPDTTASSLLRRLCFDLIGLPPTPKQSSDFERDFKRDPDAAVQGIVDWLMDQPQYGERWGRHWLDLARYAESTGREVNMTYPEAWRYRDYVIAAFNNDKPYDRFLKEQIAGDLLEASTDQQRTMNLVATGFLAIGPKALIERNSRQFELDLVDEQIDVTTRVMLGVSVACARCHDHKFDPIPQADYYALSGIFRSMTTHYGTSRSRQNRQPSSLANLPNSAATPFDQPVTKSQLAQLESELETKERELREGLRDRRRQKSQPQTSSPQSRIRQAAQLSSAIGTIQSILDSYQEDGTPKARCMAVEESTPVTAKLLERGEFNRPGPAVPRGFPQVLCESTIQIAKDSTGRQEFAQWIGSTDNPLTARVMVNRVWLHLLGNGIVRTPEDFGSTGEAPTHPELLDYLAVQFMDDGWSVKKLVRSIVTSRVYRMSSRFDQASFDADPENRYLWRIDPKRLEAEAIRDAMLAASGQLQSKPPVGSLVGEAGPALVREGRLFAFRLADSNNPQTPRRQPQNRMGYDMLGTDLLRPYTQSLDEPASCRSVYLPIVRDYIPRSLDVFDFAEASMVIGKRDTSTTADQGLYFLNNEFVMQQADAMAKRLLGASNDLDEQINQAFALLYGRRPNAKELRFAKDFHRSYDSRDEQSTRETLQKGDRPIRSARPQRPGRRPSAPPAPPIELLKLSSLCQSLMAAGEFRYLD